MSSKQKSILLGASAVAIISLLGGMVSQSFLGNQVVSGIVGMLVCCIVPLVGGFLAVWHYTETNKLTITSGEGAGIGAIVGTVGIIISSVITYLLQLLHLLPSNAEVFERVKEGMIEQWQAQGMSDEEINQALQMSEGWMNSSPIIQVAMSIVIFAVMGAIFGAIAAAIFKKGTDTVA